MKNTIFGKLVVFLISLVVLVSSCNAKIEGELKQGGSAELHIQAALEPMTAALIRSLRSFLGQGAGAPLMDAEALSRSMSAAPGIKALSLSNTTSSSIEGTISLSNVGNFLSVVGERRFITYTEGQRDSSIVINLDRESAPAIISRLSTEAEEYLLALMAPVMTGEASSKQEYLALVSMVYGRPLADEIASARILASIDLPRPVTAVKGGTARAKRAEFTVPLLDLLVLETPLRYEISW